MRVNQLTLSRFHPRCLVGYERQGKLSVELCSCFQLGRISDLTLPGCLVG